MGTQVLVPFRGSEDSHRHLKLMGDLGQVHSLFFIFLFLGFIIHTQLLSLTQIVPMKYNPRDENSIKAVMAKANVVVNLIGTLSSPTFMSHNFLHLYFPHSWTL
jgi:NADH dehydrogenase (ubiquinone) 1 alpha subcomplex subunit 9